LTHREFVGCAGNDLRPDTMANKTFRIIGERTRVGDDGRIEYLALVNLAEASLSPDDFLLGNWLGPFH
jgi:hypothetical protein